MQFNKYRQYALAILNFIVIFMTYGMFLIKHYSVDSYTCYFNNGIDAHLLSSRYVNYFLIKLLNIFDINLVEAQSVFTFFFIVVLSFISTKISLMVYNLLCSESTLLFCLVDLAVLISFVNVFILEWFLFPETMLFYACSLMACFYAVIVISENFSWKNILGASVLLLISICCYQASLGFFVIYALTIIMLKNNFKLNRKSFINSSIILIIGASASFIAILSQRIVRLFLENLGSSRTAKLSISLLVSNAQSILDTQKKIWLYGFNLLPKYILLFLGFILLVSIIAAFSKKRVSSILYLILLLVANYAITFAPHLLLDTQWYPPRTIVSFFAFFSSIFIIAIFLYKNNYKHIILFYGLIGAFLVINYIKIEDIGLNSFANNKLDESIAHMIETQIKDYEKLNNITIKNISIVNDELPSYSYPEVNYCIYDTNVKAFAVPWTAVNTINYYNSENYTQVPMDTAIYNKYFKGKNWDQFKPAEQMIFVGDTLYCVTN